VLCFPLNNVLPPATAERWRERSIGNLVARAKARVPEGTTGRIVLDLNPRQCE